MLDWLIVGGGVHGTLLSHWLVCARGAGAETLRVLDPHAEPLAEWRRCTSNVGMRFLRSPSVHGLDVSPMALSQFAKTGRGARVAAWRGRYARPSLALFDAHCRHLVECRRLGALRVRSRAVALARRPHGWRVETPNGGLEARRVVLAIGLGEQPAWPDWARDARDAGAQVDHVFDPGFERSSIAASERVAVIGGGITAAQTAMALAARAPGRIALVARHAPRVVDFDSDPGWLGPKYLAAFEREPDPVARRAAIRRARHRGSMPHDVHGALRGSTQRGDLASIVDEVKKATLRSDGALDLALASGAALVTDRLLLATGFDPCRPGGAWIDRAIAEHGLAVAPCGHPLLDGALRWAPGLHAMGPLAELAIGPVARNIAGARMAAERLLDAA